ncbi:hypothetical protein PKHYL_08100 [Psychrobacter sp. KH172YL61]|nr:hypothetical protein PKHYL_08100 [Psychrobacter sp. KH172YL61]
MTIDSIPLNLSTLCNEVVSLFSIKARQRGLTLDYHYTESLSPYVKGGSSTPQTNHRKSCE